MSSSTRSTMIARLFAGVSAVAALAIAVPSFADTVAKPAEKPVAASTDMKATDAKTADVKTDAKTSDTKVPETKAGDMKATAPTAIVPPASVKSSGASSETKTTKPMKSSEAKAVKETKVASNETVAKHHHKVVKSDKPVEEKTTTPVVGK